MVVKDAEHYHLGGEEKKKNISVSAWRPLFAWARTWGGGAWCNCSKLLKSKKRKKIKSFLLSLCHLIIFEMSLQYLGVRYRQVIQIHASKMTGHFLVLSVSLVWKSFFTFFYWKLYQFSLLGISAKYCTGW